MASVGSPHSPPREISEAELRSLLGTPIVQTVFAMGVDLSSVQQACRNMGKVEVHREASISKVPENSEKVTAYLCIPEISAQLGTQCSETDRTQILEEIRRLKEARLCKVCLDEEVSIACIPCRHTVTCVPCMAALDHRPLCRKNIKGTVRVFLSWIFSGI